MYIHRTSNLSVPPCELSLGSRCLWVSKNTHPGRGHAQRNSYHCGSRLKPHLQCCLLGCQKEISLCRLWTGNQCSVFHSPTLVDFILDHMPNPVESVYVCLIWRITGVTGLRVRVFHPLSLLSVSSSLCLVWYPLFNLKAWDWEEVWMQNQTRPFCEVRRWQKEVKADKHHQQQCSTNTEIWMKDRAGMAELKAKGRRS